MAKQPTRVETQRLEREAIARRRALPSRPQTAALNKNSLLIPSSPLLAGQRPDISLASAELQDQVAGLASLLDAYNAHVQTRGVLTTGTVIDQDLLATLDALIKAAGRIDASSLDPPPG